MALSIYLIIKYYLKENYNKIVWKGCELKKFKISKGGKLEMCPFLTASCDPPSNHPSGVTPLPIMTPTLSQLGT